MMDLAFTITGAAPDPGAASPTLMFRLRIAASRPVHALLLRCLIQVDPRRRGHSPLQAERLVDLFGEPGRWRETVRPLVLARPSVTTPAFDESIDIDVPVACTYDFEVSAAKYMDALEGGEAPLLFLFSGTAFLKTAHGGPGMPGPYESEGAGYIRPGFEVCQVSWDKEASYRLPVRLWRETLDAHFPGCAWLRLRRESLDALQRYRARHGFMSWDEAIEAMIGSAGSPAGPFLAGGGGAAGAAQ